MTEFLQLLWSSSNLNRNFLARSPKTHVLKANCVIPCVFSVVADWSHATIFNKLRHGKPKAFQTFQIWQNSPKWRKSSEHFFHPSHSLLMVRGHVSCCHYNSPDPAMCSMWPTIERRFIDLVNPFSAKLTLTPHTLKGDTCKPPNKIPQKWFVLHTIQSILMLTLEKTWKHFELVFFFFSYLKPEGDKHCKCLVGFFFVSLSPLSFLLGGET